MSFVAQRLRVDLKRQHQTLVLLLNHVRKLAKNLSVKGEGEQSADCGIWFFFVLFFLPVPLH